MVDFWLFSEGVAARKAGYECWSVAWPDWKAGWRSVVPDHHWKQPKRYKDITWVGETPSVSQSGIVPSFQRKLPAHWATPGAVGFVVTQ